MPYDVRVCLIHRPLLMMIVMSHDHYQCGVVFLVLRLLCNKMRKWPPPHNRSTAITSWSPSSTPSWSSRSASFSSSKYFHNEHHQQFFFANDTGCLRKRYFSEISLWPVIKKLWWLVSGGSNHHLFNIHAWGLATNNESSASSPPITERNFWKITFFRDIWAKF